MTTHQQFHESTAGLEVRGNTIDVFFVQNFHVFIRNSHWIFSKWVSSSSTIVSKLVAKKGNTWDSLLAGGRRYFYGGKLPVQLLPPPSLISGRANLRRRQNGERGGGAMVSSPGSRGQKSKMAAAIAGLGVFRHKNTVYRLQAGYT